jgi:catechol 2,3-dioxygenase-like lactoylglutathione lyase family enzyme
MCRITDPDRSRAFYEALGFTFAGDFDIVRDGQVEATNYFFSLGDQESGIRGSATRTGTPRGGVTIQRAGCLDARRAGDALRRPLPDLRGI